MEVPPERITAIKIYKLLYSCSYIKAREVEGAHLDRINNDATRGIEVFLKDYRNFEIALNYSVEVIYFIHL